MATATVTGTFRNVGGANLNYLDPEVIFQVNKPAIGSAGQFFATEPITVTPESDSSWSVVLEVTDGLLTEDVYYTVSAQWRDPAGNYIKADFPDWKLYVPAGGGVFGDLIAQGSGPGNGNGANPFMVILAASAPATTFGKNTWWLQGDPADPLNPDNPSNTSILHRLQEA